MAFTYDLSTDAGKVRLRIGDTDSAAYAFEDTEIAYFVTTGGTVTAAARLAVQTLMASKATRIKRFSLPGTSYDDTAQMAALQTLWLSLGGGMATATVFLPDPHPFDEAYDRTVTA